MANWGAIVGGVLAAGSTIYAANQQKKMQQEQYKQQQNLYNEQMQYQQNQINSARNTPIAQLAPIFMEQLINAYSGKLSKYGINFPVDEMMRIIGRGGGASGGQGGNGGGMQATMMPLVDAGGSRGYRKAEQTDFQDQHSEESRRQMMAVGGGTGRLLRHAVDTSGGAYADAIWNQETGNVLRSMGYGGSPQLGFQPVQLAPGVQLTGVSQDSDQMAASMYSHLPEFLQRAWLGQAAMDENNKVLGNLGQLGIGQGISALLGPLGSLYNLGASAVDRNPYPMLEAWKGSYEQLPDVFQGPWNDSSLYLRQ